MPKEKKSNITSEGKGVQKLTVKQCKDTMSRLVSKLSITERGCLEVNLVAKNEAGYKDVFVDGFKQKFLFHHVAYVAATGKQVPIGKQWIHRCHNPGCGEVTHGYWGSRALNEETKQCCIVLVGDKKILVCNHDPQCIPTKTLTGKYIE